MKVIVAPMLNECFRTNKGIKETLSDASLDTKIRNKVQNLLPCVGDNYHCC